MTEPSNFLNIPTEIRLLIYRRVFKDFILQLNDAETLVPYNCDADFSVNQLCRVNKQIRQESLPILASSLKIICSPKLLDRGDCPPQHTLGPTVPQTSVPRPLHAAPGIAVVTPKLSPLFAANVRSLSISLSSVWIPDYSNFPNLEKIAVDAWFSHPAITEAKDKDLAEMVQTYMAASWLPECCYPAWLKAIYRNIPQTVTLAMQEVWSVEGKEGTETSHLKALINLKTGKVEHREEGGKDLEHYDIAPVEWLYR